MFKTLLKAMFFLCIPIVIILVRHYFYLVDISERTFRFGDTSELNFVGLELVIVLVGTLIGILTSFFVSSFQSVGIKSSAKKTFHFENLCLGCLLAPVVVSGFYGNIVNINSYTIIFLLAHNNGYFWENIGGAMRRVQPKD